MAAAGWKSIFLPEENQRPTLVLSEALPKIPESTEKGCFGEESGTSLFLSIDEIKHLVLKDRGYFHYIQTDWFHHQTASCSAGLNE